MFKSIFTILTISTLFFSTTASAQTQISKPITTDLKTKLETLASNPSVNPFELATYEVLHAIEKTLQTRYKYGLGDRISRLPLLRIPLGNKRNYAAKSPSADTVSKMLDQFIVDIDTAQATLIKAEQTGINAFEMTLQDIWFDVNNNAKLDKGETVIELLAPVLLGRNAMRNFKKSNQFDTPVVVRFDRADHAWLSAYTHMLSGIGNLILAFDPALALANLARQRTLLQNAPQLPLFYDPKETQAEIDQLLVELQGINTQTDTINAQIKAINGSLKLLRLKNDQLLKQLIYKKTPEGLTEEEKSFLNIESAKVESMIESAKSDIKLLNVKKREFRRTQRTIQNEIRAAKAKLPSQPDKRISTLQDYMPALDMIHVVMKSLEQQPDAERLQNVQQNWRSLIDYNQIFWSELSKETDNNHEWVPNPSQTSVLNVSVPERLAEAWQKILQDAEAILDGKLLIPHPFLPAGHGLNLKAYLDDPTPIKAFEWIHGIGSYRYVAKGSLMTQQNWRAFSRLANGQPGAYALFFN